MRPLPHRPLCRNHHAPASEVATNYTQEMGVPKLPIEHCLVAFQTNHQLLNVILVAIGVLHLPAANDSWFECVSEHSENPCQLHEAFVKIVQSHIQPTKGIHPTKPPVTQRFPQQFWKQQERRNCKASEVLNHCAHTGIDHTPICRNILYICIYVYKSENIHSQKQRLRFPTWIPLLALH